MTRTVTLDETLLSESITGSKASFLDMHIESVAVQAKAKRDSVTDITLSGCTIDDITFIPIIFPRATMLKVSNCKINEEQLTELGSLRLVVLNISGCKLTKMPMELLRPGLKALILSDNSIKEIPPLLHNVSKALRNMRITYNLNTLVMSRNPLTNDAIMDKFADFPCLRKVNLSECKLTECPQILSASIREVRLSHNQISTIPESWVCVTKLRQLELGHNNITMIRDVSALSKTNWLHNLGLAGNPCMEREEVVSYLKTMLAKVNPNMRVNQIIVSSLTTQKPREKID